MTWGCDGVDWGRSSPPSDTVVVLSAGPSGRPANCFLTRSSPKRRCATDGSASRLDGHGPRCHALGLARGTRSRPMDGKALSFPLRQSRLHQAQAPLAQTLSGLPNGQGKA